MIFCNPILFYFALQYIVYKISKFFLLIQCLSGPEVLSQFFGAEGWRFKARLTPFINSLAKMREFSGRIRKRTLKYPTNKFSCKILKNEVKKSNCEFDRSTELEMKEQRTKQKVEKRNHSFGGSQT